MATVKSFPNNSDTYIGAEDVMKWHHGRGKGVYGADDNLAVRALVSPAMAVTVSDGIGWMVDEDGNGIAFWCDEEAQQGTALQLPVTTAHATYARIDRVIVEWSLPDYTALPQIKVLKGTAAASPVAPALTNNSAKRQISLARIRVNAGATTIVSANITDERLDSTVCGLVTDNISVDTSAMSAQWNAMVTELQEELARVIEGGLPNHAYTHLATGTDPLAALVPNGGTTGQVLKKASATDYDLEWGAASGIPSGGTAGQVLAKNSATAYDVGWATKHDIPSGGTTGQVLTKTSGTAYDVAWATPSSGGTITWTNIWTNSSPSASFDAQTVTISAMANYQFIYIACRFTTDSTTQKAGGFCPINISGTAKGGTLSGASSSYAYFRGFTVNTANTEIEFTKAFRFDGSGTGSGNGYLIPYKIYGGKIQ